MGSDYGDRAICGDAGDWFGVTPAQLPTIFPNIASFATKNLGFV